MRALLSLAVALLAGGDAALGQAAPTEGVVKLFVHDDLRRTFGFTTGDYGCVIQDGIVHNRNSQLVLGKDSAGKDVLRLGWQGGEQGVCVDLGVLRDKATGSSLFWRIDHEEAKQRLVRESGPQPVAVEIDHVYVARIHNVAVAGAGIPEGGTLFVRLHVLDHAPTRFVELRYAILHEAQPRAALGPNLQAPAWMRSDVRRPEDAFDAKSLVPLDWPAYVTAAERERVVELIEAVRLGKPAERRELVGMGHKALTGVVNRLREIDYFDVEETRFGWQLNRVLEEMTLGMNVGYVPVQPGERIDPRQADWNAKTAKAWQKLLRLYPTPEAWERLVRTRKARRGR